LQWISHRELLFFQPGAKLCQFLNLKTRAQVVSTKLTNTVAKHRLDVVVNRANLMRLSLIAFISAIVALAGPFGTFGAGAFDDRLIYWFVLILVSVCIALSAKNLIQRYLNDWTKFSKEAVIVLVMTLVFPPFVWYWTITIFPSFAASAPPFIWFVAVVFTICISGSVLAGFLPMLVMRPDLTEKPIAKQARIVRRLPASFNGKIIHLSVDGHVVKVNTDQGGFDVRMRFSDAVNEVSELKGACTHRSHWVVLDEIIRVGNVNGRPCLLLSNNEEVPVSRKYQPNLEALGIL
jgi:hypothetical protein